jgi:hypothetical protein
MNKGVIQMRSVIFAVLLILSADCFSQNVPPRFTMEWEALAEHLVGQLDLQPGERFLAVAHPGLFDELIPHLRYEVMKAGGVDLGVIDVLAEPVPEAWNNTVLRDGGRAARSTLADMLENVDASIMLPGANPGHPVYAAIQDNLRKGIGRTIHFHWLQNGSAYTLPGQPLPPLHNVEATYQRALLHADYEALAAHQRRFAQAMRGGEVRVTNAAGTDIRFRIGDRPVNFQDGDASAARADKGVILIDREIELPAGAVRVAPLEDSVSGTIAFPPSQWSGKAVTGLKLTFEAGNVVEVTAESGKDAVEAEMAQAGTSGRAFREFALGFHPSLAVPERNPWIPYYGYGAGVVRLSLGDNSELGGDVSGGYVRWNFFTDTTVTIDGEVWVREGKLVN